MVKKIIYLFLFIVVILLGYTYVFKSPSHEREWEKHFSKLPIIDIRNGEITVSNFRDFHLDDGKNVVDDYTQRDVQIDDLEQVWIMVEPFTIKPFTGFRGVAHTYFTFDFKNADPITVSVEARREKGEKYDAVRGLFHNYELMYVWGTERDQTVRRVVEQGNEVFMYPLQISREGAKSLLLQMAETTRSLETQPRFCNTFYSNCTNELAKNANRVKEGAIPLNRALYLPGYTAEELYNLKFIPHDRPLDEIRQRYALAEKVRALPLDENFSRALREKLQ